MTHCIHLCVILDDYQLWLNYVFKWSNKSNQKSTKVPEVRGFDHHHQHGCVSQQRHHVQGHHEEYPCQVLEACLGVGQCAQLSARGWREGRPQPPPQALIGCRIIEVRGQRWTRVFHSSQWEFQNRHKKRSIRPRPHLPLGGARWFILLRSQTYTTFPCWKKKRRRHQQIGSVFGDSFVFTVNHHRPGFVVENNTTTDIKVYHCKSQPTVAQSYLKFACISLVKPCSVLMIAMSHLILSRDNNNNCMSNPQWKWHFSVI